jgi:hypothetical protein
MIMEIGNTKETRFSTGAAFRIYGVGLDLDDITRQLGASPDHRHTKGDLDPGGKPYAHDMWSLGSPLAKDEELEVHLLWLAEKLLSSRDYILSLKKGFKVDIYSWKDCFTEQSSLVLSTGALRIFTELDIGLSISLLCLPDESKTKDGAGGWDTRSEPPRAE